MNPLASAKPDEALETITNWPIAAGWWILAIMTLIVIVLTAHFFIKQYRKNAWRRSALKEFRTLRDGYLEKHSTHQLVMLIRLLKRCAASRQHSQTLLAKTGKDWQDCLSLPKGVLSESDIQTLSESQYKPIVTELDQSALKRIETWIKGQA